MADAGWWVVTTEFRREASPTAPSNAGAPILRPSLAGYDIAAPGEPTDSRTTAQRAAGDMSDLALARPGAGMTRIVADGLALCVAAVEAAALLGAVHTVHRQGVVAFTFSTMTLRLFASVPVMVAILGTARARLHVRRSLGAQVHALAPPIAVGGMVCLLGWQAAQAAGLVMAPPDGAIVLMCLLGIVTVTAGRMVIETPRIDALGGRTRRVLLVGSGVVADRVTETLQGESDVTVVGFVDDDPMAQEGWLGKLADLGTMCEEHNVDHVIVGFSRASSEEIIESLRPIQGSLPITVIPRLFDVLPVTASVHDLGSGITGIGVPPATLGSAPRFIKRSMDVVGAGTALILLSPLLAAVALAIRCTSRGPVLYRQARVGKSGLDFEVLKFRSMLVSQTINHPSQLTGEAVKGPFPKLKDDPRVTPIGRFIRRTSIDELPQLWNVVRGDMSLVGPRPFIHSDAAWITGWAQRRYSVRPGITGLWQVSGRNNLTFDEMCRLDSLYVASWSVGLDLRILVRTLRAVVTSHGAF
jgi:exopolysaccharide biosynthesis polyprenyl glycosylphosphotransferase